ncbi:hypothetical protein [Burkholderia cenocepacia]|uniref:hypothetical protein n=1 Tax=Burkholderia cenocepacia TaxID=95486 RepID=UPI00201316E1|nr:hypothetical protein [Burkholderia cenocepacia]
MATLDEVLAAITRAQSADELAAAGELAAKLRTDEEKEIARTAYADKMAAARASARGDSLFDDGEITYAYVMDRIAHAATADELNDAHDLVRFVPDEQQRKELTEAGQARATSSLSASKRNRRSPCRRTTDMKPRFHAEPLSSEKPMCNRAHTHTSTCCQTMRCCASTPCWLSCRCRARHGIAACAGASFRSVAARPTHTRMACARHSACACGKSAESAGRNRRVALEHQRVVRYDG